MELIMMIIVNVKILLFIIFHNIIKIIYPIISFEYLLSLITLSMVSKMSYCNEWRKRGKTRMPRDKDIKGVTVFTLPAGTEILKRKIGNLRTTEFVDGEYTRLGTDSHADISCIGSSGYIIRVHSGKTCNVMPFNDGCYEPLKNVQIVDAVFKVQLDTGEQVLIVVNQGLNFKDSMRHSILCTNQARHHGTIVNDTPKLFDQMSSQSIITHEDNTEIRLDMYGPVAYVQVTTPTESDVRNLRRVSLTSDCVEWNPHEIFGDTTYSIDSNTLQLFDDDVYDGDIWDENVKIVDEMGIISGIVRVSSIEMKSEKDRLASRLASYWRVGLKTAERTLRCTTQHSMRHLKGKLTRRVRTRIHQRRYNQLHGHLGRFCSDTFTSKVTSLRGNKKFQLFSNRGNYAKLYPMKTESQASDALNTFLHEVGVPVELHTDGAKTMTEGEWSKTCRKHKIHMTRTEPYSPWQNPAELAGGIIKRRCKDIMRKTNTPVVLWDYCMEHIVELRNMTSSDRVVLLDKTPFELIHNYTPDISELIEFGWYDWVWYWDPLDKDSKVGRWLGPAHNTGQGLAFYILTSNGEVVTRSTVSNIDKTEFDTMEMKIRRDKFTQSVNEKIGDYSKSMLSHHDIKPGPTFDVYDDMYEPDDLDDDEIIYQDTDERGIPLKSIDLDDVNITDNDGINEEEGDKYIGMKVPLNRRGEIQEGIVKRRKRTDDSNELVGTSNSNPLLDTRMYEVQFPDGSYESYSTNSLVENIYMQVDDHGRTEQLLQEIVDHRSTSDALDRVDGWITLENGVRKRRITTKGWKLKVEWTDGTASWIPLADLKEANPIETAEYAVSRGLHEEPAFAWWVQKTLKKRNKIIKKVKHRMAKKNLKYGVVVPSTVEEALELDKANGNDLWSKAIAKEIGNVKVAFRVLENNEPIPTGSKLIDYHIIFDVKMDLTRKARLVAGGHRNKGVPSHLTFSSVASRDSVRIMLLIAALNNLKVLSTDIGNAYLNASCREKVHVRIGAELFGVEHKGKYAVIVRALYGLKSAGASWRAHLSEEIRTMGFVTTVADNDVYRRAQIDKENRSYYEYLVVYVDDIICISHEPETYMNHLQNAYRLRDIKVPDKFLGTDIKVWDYQDDEGIHKKCWALGSSTYVKEAVNVVERLMNKHGLKYPSTRRHGSNSPFSSASYRPELDDSEPCNDELHTVYQNIIGILRWIVELGRIDINLEVSLLSQYLAAPRYGHLLQACNIIKYVGKYNNSNVILDPTKWDVRWEGEDGEIHPKTLARSMSELYPDARIEIPPNAPKPLGESVIISMFVDADHAGNRVTRRSHTGIVIYINSAPIIWYSKRQNTVESSTFGSEIIALRIGIELVEGLVYKLMMFGIPIECETRIFCDNKAVVNSGTRPDCRLKKKHNSIAFHKIREYVAAGKALVYYEHSESNVADLLTKVLSVEKRNKLIYILLG